METEHVLSKLREAVPPLAREYQWRVAVLFGSTAAGEAGRDIDVAVIPSRVPDLFEHGRWIRLLEEASGVAPIDLLLLTAASSPDIRYRVFRYGRCVFEAEPGLFEHEWDRAFFLYADSAFLKRKAREAAHGG